jgi:hypothetical protein
MAKQKKQINAALWHTAVSMYALCQHFSSASIIIIISLSSFFAPTFSAAFHINKSLRDVHPSGAKCAEIRNFLCKKEQEFFP